MDAGTIAADDDGDSSPPRFFLAGDGTAFLSSSVRAPAPCFIPAVQLQQAQLRGAAA
jgi:hypothetical protein